MTSRGFQRWRTIAGVAQALLALGLPFATVGGESALRLDVPAGRLHAFGASFAIDEAFVVLAAALLLTAAFLWVTLLFGRAWCGWSCPQTILSDLTRWALPDPRRPWTRPAGLAGLALVSALFSAAVLWYFITPWDFVARLAAGQLGPMLGGAWVVLWAALFLDLALVRQDFCKTACPYARLQGVLLDRSSLVVAYDAARSADCVDCGACVRVCPTGIDIRHGLQMECIACAACIDACTPIMARLRRPPDLVGYAFGEPGGRRRPLRPASLALGAATATAAAALVAVVALRSVVSLVPLPQAAIPARRTAEGATVNAYLVALENHARAPVDVRLSLAAPGAPAGEVALRPAGVHLEPGERRQVRLIATSRGLPPGRLSVALRSEVRAGDKILERREAALSLVVPEVP